MLLSCEILMPEKQWQPETFIMIDNTSQLCIAPWFRCGGAVDHCSITNLLLSLFWKNFWNHSTFGKVMEIKFIASSVLDARALSCWKMKNSLEIWHMAGRNCCNSIMLWVILLTNLDYVIDKCQTGVMSTTCYSPTDAISDWMLIVCTCVLSRCLSSWLIDMHTVSHSAGF